MPDFVPRIKSFATENRHFREVQYTATGCQLVRLAIPPDEESGEAVHPLDQFFRVEAGTGAAVLDGITSPIGAGFAVLVPAGMRHDFINTGGVPLVLYTLAELPSHGEWRVHHARADANVADAHYVCGAVR
jgi:mannose-6-phosphate isomerase-like protein (cupin superfamily)